MAGYYRRYIIAAVALIALLSLALGGTPAASQDLPERYRALLDKAGRQGPLLVIATLNAGFRPEGSLSRFAGFAQRGAIRAIQNRVLAALNGRFTVVAQFDHVPILTLRADQTALRALILSPDVTHVVEDIPVPPLDAASNTVIGTPTVWNTGYRGAGWAVAIMDTGMQIDHPFFGSRVVDGACFSRTEGSSVTLCPNGQSTGPAGQPGQTGGAAASNCATSIPFCDHGTHVAGIAAGDDPADVADGVAPEANILAIQVFSLFNDAGVCGSPAATPCIRSFGTDQIAALNYLYTTMLPNYRIAAVNISLGANNAVTPPCDLNPLKPAIDNLRSVNVATVIATGNNGATGAISEPSCISTAVSVSATDNNDNVALFSNISNAMTLYAPGKGITSAVPGSATGVKDGTSMAAPHVTGAWALLKQRMPGASVSDLINLTRSTGKTINFFNLVIAPRLRLDQAMVALNYDSIGVFRPSNATFYLRTVNTTGPANLTAVLGLGSDLPVAGDWDGDGVDTIGVFRPGTAQFFLRNANTPGAPVVYTLTVGNPNDVPLAGDWDGDGRDSVGVFRPTNGRIFLRNALTTGIADYVMVFGVAGDQPVAGDWDNNGVDSVGVYRGNRFFLTNTVCANCIPAANYSFVLGNVGDVPIAGDWDGDGVNSGGVFRPTNGRIFLRNALTTGVADVSIVYGIANDRPLAGRWVTVAAPPSPDASVESAPAFEPPR